MLSGFPEAASFMERYKVDPDQFQNTLIINIYDNLWNYTGEFIHAGHELREYVKNGFNSEDEARYDKTICLTRLGFIIALFGVIASILLSVCSSTKINNQQYRELIEAIHKTEQSIVSAPEEVATPENIIYTMQ